MSIKPICPSTYVHAANDTAAADETDTVPTANNHRLRQWIRQEFQAEMPSLSPRHQAIVNRIAAEVERICSKSDRIQQSQDPAAWQMTLARHRVSKCLHYFRLGSRQGRVELHSHLSSIVYRYVAPTRSRLGFQGRYVLLEDFLQGFYIEALKAFRREHQLPEDYSPKTQLELAEYMAFCEQYAKRKISLPGQRNQQLIILRAQSFSRRQPQEATVDIELAVESPRDDDAQGHSRSQVMGQIREQMVTDAVDPTERVLRDRVIDELIAYLRSQDQEDCINYFVLKLQDLPAAEIDDILGLSTRERDYLQQRFKYHVEKFARTHHWQLVHQWLGADLDQNLGLSESQWQTFIEQLTPQQQQLLELKMAQSRSRDRKEPSDADIAKILKCTPKQVKRRWVKLLDQAWQCRNSE
jgi:hypothetical protein